MLTTYSLGLILQVVNDDILIHSTKVFEWIIVLIANPGTTMTVLITSGASWTLTFEEQIDAETLSFKVGEDCPYYDNGYTTAKLHIKGILGIEVEGPGGELYVKLKQGTVLPDCDFETNSCGWNDAVELNSTEFFRFARTKGSLHPTGDYAPPTDHVNNAEGFYMWTSALLGKPGDHTELTSPKVACCKIIHQTFTYTLSCHIPSKQRRII